MLPAKTKAIRQPLIPLAARPWLVLLLFLGFGWLCWYFAPKREGPNRPLSPSTQLWLLVPFIALFVCWMLAYASQYFRTNDVGVRRANKRALAGDLDGAIEDLREQIEHKEPTLLRANALGLLLMQAERWAEAAAFYRKAEEFGIPKIACQANLGLALLNSGNPEEALRILQGALHIAPQVPVMTCFVSLNTCLALSELGRWDEAHEQFRVAEEAAGGVNRENRAAIATGLEKCRQKLEQHPQDKPKPDGLAEL